MTARTFLPFFNLVMKCEGFHENTCILAGLRTSNEADALKDDEAKGLDNVTEFTTVEL
jgi:hypothetical protein